MSRKELKGNRMMKVKLMVLPVCLAAGLGMIYFLPSAGAVAGSAVRMELPQEENDWWLRPIPPSKEELDILAKDTEFSKAICFKRRPGEFLNDGNPNYDRMDLSIVLSGVDLNNSIHRPERCMPSQGHTILSGSDVIIPLANGRELTVRRLRSTQKKALSEDRMDTRDLNCVTYYFFVGHNKTAHGHLQRTLLDMKDRIVYGMDQRWAYVSLSMWYGKMPWFDELDISEKEADEKLVRFLADFAERQIDWSEIVQ